MIVTLLFHFTVYVLEGLEQLWVKAGVGKTTRFIPIHSLHQMLTPNLAKVLPALHSLTGCDITSKIGTKKAALKADPIKYLLGFGVSATMNDSVIKEAEHYLVNVVDSKCRGNDFNQLRTYHFHRSKSSTLHNLPPTSQGVGPHIQRAYFNAYTAMDILDKQLGISTIKIDPLNYGLIHGNGSLLPLKTWKHLEPHTGM